jgi:hypothetical protein
MSIRYPFNLLAYQRLSFFRAQIKMDVWESVTKMSHGIRGLNKISPVWIGRSKRGKLLIDLKKTTIDVNFMDTLYFDISGYFGD